MPLTQLPRFPRPQPRKIATAQQRTLLRRAVVLRQARKPEAECRSWVILSGTNTTPAVSVAVPVGAVGFAKMTEEMTRLFRKKTGGRHEEGA